MTSYKPAWDLRTIPDTEFHSEAARRRGANSPRRAKVLRPCPKCGSMLGARELRAHVPRCEGARS